MANHWKRVLEKKVLRKDKLEELLDEITMPSRRLLMKMKALRWEIEKLA